jgi:uncharacterized protein with PIN domain
MIDKGIQEIAKEHYWNSDASGSLTSRQCYTLGFVDGAKELAKINEQLQERIYELQSDLSRVKSLNEKMKRCSNCVHRFVRHFSQEGTCQRPNCKNYSDWCFDGQFTEIEK